ncbi:acyltransferase family protein, partial [Halalkalibacter wakoensis]|uniref:acyltransferase family protein n=1 Tax=Halalkalibacter wakoensis TaxID=127891 RepID=UPI00054FB00A
SLRKQKQTPAWIKMLSTYSFGIYLLHPFVQTLVSRQLTVNDMSQIAYLFIQFIAGVLVPILLVYLVSKWSYGGYVVGKIATPIRKGHSKLGEAKVA